MVNMSYHQSLQKHTQTLNPKQPRKRNNKKKRVSVIYLFLYSLYCDLMYFSCWYMCQAFPFGKQECACFGDYPRLFLEYSCSTQISQDFFPSFSVRFLYLRQHLSWFIHIYFNSYLFTKLRDDSCHFATIAAF